MKKVLVIFLGIGLFVYGFLRVSNYWIGGFCGGIANFSCLGYCKLDGSYPDAGGVCIGFSPSLKQKPSSSATTPTPDTGQTDDLSISEDFHYQLWQTYTNPKYGLVFNYPGDYQLEETDNPAATHFTVTLTGPNERIALDIQQSTSNHYLGFSPSNSKSINNLTWSLIEDQTYCDAGDCGEPFTVYQTLNDGTKYSFIIYDDFSREDLEKILSTFQFLK